MRDATRYDRGGPGREEPTGVVERHGEDRGGRGGRGGEGTPFRESTRTIIRSRAGSSKDPRDDISMPCLRNNFNYPRYTKKNTKSNARNSDARRAPAHLLTRPAPDPFLPSPLPRVLALGSRWRSSVALCRVLLYRHPMHLSSSPLPFPSLGGYVPCWNWPRCQWTTTDSLVRSLESVRSPVYTYAYVIVRVGARSRIRGGPNLSTGNKLTSCRKLANRSVGRKARSRRRRRRRREKGQRLFPAVANKKPPFAHSLPKCRLYERSQAKPRGLFRSGNLLFMARDSLRNKCAFIRKNNGR